MKKTGKYHPSFPKQMSVRVGMVVCEKYAENYQKGIDGNEKRTFKSI